MAGAAVEGAGEGVEGLARVGVGGGGAGGVDVVDEGGGEGDGEEGEDGVDGGEEEVEMVEEGGARVGLGGGVSMMSLLFGREGGWEGGTGLQMAQLPQRGT